MSRSRVIASNWGGATIEGSVVPGFEPVIDAFQRNFALGRELGAAFSAYADGELAVDLWAGLADSRRHSPWAADTLVGILSGSKGLVAACLARLIEHGELDLDASVCHYWPEFATNGKSGILVRHVVSHQAGLPGLTTPVTVEEATDSVRMAQLLASQRPVYAPGREVQYHALTFGWLSGELIRRIDGRPIGVFLQDEIARPLNLEVWIGLPPSQEHRVARVEHTRDFSSEHEELIKICEEDKYAWSVWANPPRFKDGDLASNLPLWHSAEVPGTSAIVSARSLARLYACLARGGQDGNGYELLSRATVDLVRRCAAIGPVPVIGAQIAFGVGFGVQTKDMQYGPPSDAFGHTGAGGSVHGAWPSLKAGFSYAPNLLDSFATVDSRAKALLDALYGALTA